jgi:hypothetical protein
MLRTPISQEIQVSHTTVKLNIACGNLKAISSLCPLASYVEVIQVHGEKLVSLGTTEEIIESCNPVFKKSFELDFAFEKLQLLEFLVFKAKGELTAKFKVPLASIVSSARGAYKHQITVGENSEWIQVSATTISEENSLLCVTSLLNCPVKKGLLSKKPNLQVAFSLQENLSLGSIGESSILPSVEDSADFGVIRITSKVPLSGDEYVYIHLLDCGTKEHTVISTVQICSAKVIESKDLQIPLPRIHKGYGSSKRGEALLAIRKCVRRKTFTDYLKSGGQFSLVLGVDFTASNGDPRTPGSLHHGGWIPYDPASNFDALARQYHYFNPYQRAIHEVVQILGYYDSDKVYPVFGFGGQVNGKVEHAFPLTRTENGLVYGITTLFKAYAEAFQYVRLSGPTYFAPLVHKACQYALESQAKGNDYCVLLIITDGQIMDMEETKKEVIRGSHLPLSIIIVGVGEADFSSMVTLDSDRKKLTSGDACAARDIVQFVRLEDYPIGSGAPLAAAVLEEIPQQFHDYEYNTLLNTLISDGSCTV